MGNLDKAPVVESATDAFEEDEFVGPPPGFFSQSTQAQTARPRQGPSRPRQQPASIRYRGVVTNGAYPPNQPPNRAMRPQVRSSVPQVRSSVPHVSSFAHHVSSFAPQVRSIVPQVRSFVPQALPVRTAYQDFLRQVEMMIPGVNATDLYNKITANPNQPVQLAIPSGVDSKAIQERLQQSLEASIMNAFANQQANSSNMPQSIYNMNNIDNTMSASRNGPVPPQGMPRVVLPPSEDDMAKQDLDAGAHQDEEYHEVETYSDYHPAKLTIGQQHPDPVVETSSLATVEPPDVHYQLKLPAKVIDNGLLSALQLESVIYACQQHNQLLADDKTRRGFLIGDGAGVGKGRTIAGIIYENYLCGRKKSIWLSVSTDLKLDAERDLRDIGAKIPVHLLGKFAYGRRINVDSGVIFTTYSGLVSKSQSYRGSQGTRIGQLISWVGADFNGCIVFDECHKAKNISMTKTKKQSKAAEFALELQNQLPKARVVYASATGASETKHLGYMVRLGMWGKGTPYNTFVQFCEAIDKRGVGAMELVAVDLKMRGSYIARQLSFKTTSFEIRIAQLEKSFIELYDECVDLWATALRYFSEASGYFEGDKKYSKKIWSSFWAAHQKFFKYLCIGAKVPLVIDIAKAALANDKCVVIGLQSTGEAKLTEALEDGDVNEFISTAKATFESLIENHFPAPSEPKRFKSQKSITDPVNQSPCNSSAPSVAPSNSDSSSSTVDESWHGHDVVKFVVEDGVVLAKLEEEKAASKLRKSSTKIKSDSLNKIVTRKRFSKNQKILDELAKEKKVNEKARSSRTLRAKRRALVKDTRKSRIKLPDDSDTDISNQLSISSSDGLLTSSSGTPREDDDSDFTDGGEESDETEYSGTVVGSDSDESVVDAKRPRSSPTQPPTKSGTLDTDSDSDIQITAVKTRKNPEIIFLSDDEDEEESTLSSSHPMVKHGNRLSQMRDELYKMIDSLGPKLPNNTLDDLIDRLGGPTKVAEMTGRKGRVIKDEDGQVSYRCRNEDDALENLNIAEKERFMNGEKLIAIISEAASSGISLQADRRIKNQKRRVHITIELPWSADRAIQQFGRTHRSNQTCGPEYMFIISELSGEKRFASIVAKRLESLGALTHGDRRATTESRDLSQFNIVGRYCKQALELVCRCIEREMHFADIRPEYPPGNFFRDARAAFSGCGLAKLEHSIFVPDANALKINHFLNRLLGMKVVVQNAIFKLFTDYMDRLIARKKATGQYDSGILELNPISGKTHCSPPEDFYLKTKSGLVRCTLRDVRVERGLSWDEAIQLFKNTPNPDKRAGFYVSTNTLTKAKMVFLLLREPDSVDMFRVYKPNIGRQPKADHISFLTENAKKSPEEVAKPIWQKVFDGTNTQCVHLCFFNSCKRIEAKLKCNVGLRHRKYCILSGGILTAWPYLERKVPDATARLQIVRLKLDANNRVIGPIIPQDYLDTVRSILKKGEEGVEF